MKFTKTLLLLMFIGNNLYAFENFEPVILEDVEEYLGDTDQMLNPSTQFAPTKPSQLVLEKETLTIRRITKGMVDVKINQKIINKNASKRVKFSFKATHPRLGAELGKKKNPKKGEHPFLIKLTIILNSNKIEYHVEKIDKDYIYSFEAMVKKGKNILLSTYRYPETTGANDYYIIKHDFNMKHWKTRETDLSLTLGFSDFQDFYLSGLDKYLTKEHWDFEGKRVENKFYTYGDVLFKKKSIPLDSFEFSSSYIQQQSFGSFNYKENEELTFGMKSFNPNGLCRPQDNLSSEILKKLPYARRGDSFKNKTIQNYYNQQEWYSTKKINQPLQKEEHLWLNSFKKCK